MKPPAIQRSYIGGRYAPRGSGEVFDDINPATGEVLCAVEQAGAAEVAHTVATATEGFAAWSAMMGNFYTPLKSTCVEMGDVACPY
jgi:betaine-aldehyde dehydrogenase